MITQQDIDYQSTSDREDSQKRLFVSNWQTRQRYHGSGSLIGPMDVVRITCLLMILASLAYLFVKWMVR